MPGRTADQDLPARVGENETSAISKRIGRGGLIRPSVARSWRSPALVHFENLNPIFGSKGRRLRSQDAPGLATVRRHLRAEFVCLRTNAHAILESAPPPLGLRRRSSGRSTSSHCRKSEQALREHARHHASSSRPIRCRSPTSATRQMPAVAFQDRLAIAPTHRSLDRALAAFAAGSQADELMSAVTQNGEPPKVASCSRSGFSVRRHGQELIDAPPSVGTGSAARKSCASIGSSRYCRLYRRQAPSPLDETAWTHPPLALEYALADCGARGE